MSLRKIAAELAARGHLTAYGKPHVRADSRVAAGAFSARAARVVAAQRKPEACAVGSMGSSKPRELRCWRCGTVRRVDPDRRERIVSTERRLERVKMEKAEFQRLFLGGKRAHTPFCRPTTDSDREAHFSRVRSRASNSVSDATSRQACSARTRQ
jgi:hypothetical protein